MRESSDDDFAASQDEIASMRANGSPQHEIDLLLAAQAHHGGELKRSHEICIRPEDHDAIRLFGELRWQWRTIAGFGGVQYLALDRTAYEPAMQWLGIPKKNRASVVAKMAIMERAARAALNAPRKD